jgi:hypothetical protein
MGHRRELKNIAGGIISSFKSRNNDVDGYWEIGKLYKFAIEQNIDTVELDLINITITPPTDEFQPLLKLWRSKLESNLNSRNIPITWLASAKIIAMFNQEYIKKYHNWGSAPGDHCTCTFEIIMDNGRKSSVTSGTNCRPHDPRKETRSTRRNDF